MQSTNTTTNDKIPPVLGKRRRTVTEAHEDMEAAADIHLLFEKMSADLLELYEKFPNKYDIGRAIGSIDTLNSLRTKVETAFRLGVQQQYQSAK